MGYKRTVQAELQSPTHGQAAHEALRVESQKKIHDVLSVTLTFVRVILAVETNTNLVKICNIAKKRVLTKQRGLYLDSI